MHSFVNTEKLGGSKYEKAPTEDINNDTAKLIGSYSAD